MSELRIIPADEAENLRQIWEAEETYTGRPPLTSNLIETVLALHEKVAEQEELLTGIGHQRLAQDRKLRAQEQKLAAVGDVLDKLTQETRETSYRPRYDEGMTRVIRAVREALGEVR